MKKVVVASVLLICIVQLFAPYSFFCLADDAPPQETSPSFDSNKKSLKIDPKRVKAWLEEYEFAMNTMIAYYQLRNACYAVQLLRSYKSAYILARADYADFVGKLLMADPSSYAVQTAKKLSILRKKYNPNDQVEINNRLFAARVCGPFYETDILPAENRKVKEYLDFIKKKNVKVYHFLLKGGIVW